MKHSPCIGIATVRFHGESKQGFIFQRTFWRLLALVGFNLVLLLACIGVVSPHFPTGPEFHGWRVLLLGIFGAIFSLAVVGFTTRMLYRMGHLLLLPEGICRYSYVSPILIPWQTVIAVELQLTSPSEKHGQVVRIQLCDSADTLADHHVNLAVADFALPPELVELAIRFYVEGRGNINAIGTEEELACLHAELRLV